MSEERSDGFAVPIHRALTEPMLVKGIPRNYLILCWGMTAALVLGMQNWYAIVPGILLHIGGKLAARYEPHFLEVVPRHLRYKSFYEG